MMELEGIVLSGVSQIYKDKCHMISLYVESKEQINKPKKKKRKETHRYKEHLEGFQMGGCWEGR